MKNEDARKILFVISIVKYCVAIIKLQIEMDL